MCQNHTHFAVMIVSTNIHRIYRTTYSTEHTQNNSTNIKCCTLSAHVNIHTCHTCIGGSQAVNSSGSTTSSICVHLTRQVHIVQQSCAGSIQQLHHKRLRQRQGYNAVTTLMTSWMLSFKTLSCICLNHSVYPSPLSGWW